MILSGFLLLATALLAAQPAFSACPALPSPLPTFANLPSVSTLPNPFQFFNGTRLTSTADWACRKAEIKTLVQEYLYGYYPDHSLETVTATRSGNTVTVTVKAGGKTGAFSATLNLPSGASTSNKVPIVITAGAVDNNVFIGSGVGLANFDTGTVAADSTSKTGAFWNLYSGRDVGVLTAWAWGYHRIIDALELVVPEADLARIGVTGCSRWGKGALAAGIFDDRVALTLPMSSGIEGVGPWRFFYEQGGANEKIGNIFGFAPYWSTSKLGTFVNDASRLPFDAHFLAALVAPRALVWDEGSTDYWTNPEGEAAVTFPATKTVFNWLGAGDRVGVAIRNSAHCDNSGYANIQAFMKKAFFGTTTTRDYSNISPYTADPETYPWATSVPLAAQ